MGLEIWMTQYTGYTTQFVVSPYFIFGWLSKALRSDYGNQNADEQNLLFSYMYQFLAL